MRQREGLPGGRAGRHGDRISSFLLMEGLHTSGGSPKSTHTLCCPSPCFLLFLHPWGPAGQLGASWETPHTHTHSHQLAQGHCRDQRGGGTVSQTQAQHRGPRVHTVSRVHPPHPHPCAPSAPMEPVPHVPWACRCKWPQPGPLKTTDVSSAQFWRPDSQHGPSAGSGAHSVPRPSPQLLVASGPAELCGHVTPVSASVPPGLVIPRHAQLQSPTVQQLPSSCRPRRAPSASPGHPHSNLRLTPTEPLTCARHAGPWGHCREQGTLTPSPSSADSTRGRQTAARRQEESSMSTCNRAMGGPHSLDLP